MTIMTTDGNKSNSDFNYAIRQYDIDKSAICELARIELTWNNFEEKVSTTGLAIDMLEQRISFGKYKEYNFIPWLFFDSDWRDDNRILRHRGCWREVKGLQGDEFDRSRKIEIVNEDDRKLRFVCGIECGGFDSITVSSVIRSIPRRSQMLFIDVSCLDNVLCSIGKMSLIHRTNFIAEDVVRIICDHDVFAFQPIGWFDDRESGGALISREDLVREFDVGPGE